MNWPFGRTRNAIRGKQPSLPAKEIPRDDERRGPAPPPPRTAHAPGVSVYAFADLPSQHLLRLDTGSAGFFLEGEEGDRRSVALLVLRGGGAASGVAASGTAGAALTTSPGDVLIWDAAALAAQSPPGERFPSLSLEELSRTSPKPHHSIRRDALTGRGVPGITGLRTLHCGDGFTVLRLGPPPGARWVFAGLNAIAVFSGKVTLVDGEEAKVGGAGSLALVADSTATLYFEAGNDSALAVALGGANVVAALG
ncbi:MAG: hypothetical protein ACXWFS_05630 [Thermoanaerobaculia bacterium]